MVDDIRMRTKMAPFLAKIFMRDLEEHILCHVSYTSWSWLSLIADVDMQRYVEHLQEYLDH